MNADRLRMAALTSSFLQGCQCDPEVEICEEESPGVFRVHVFHDDWCPLLRSMKAKGN